MDWTEVKAANIQIPQAGNELSPDCKGGPSSCNFCWGELAKEKYENLLERQDNRAMKRLDNAKNRISRYANSNSLHPIKLQLRNSYEIRHIYEFIEKNQQLAKKGKPVSVPFLRVKASHYYDDNSPQKYVKEINFDAFYDGEDPRLINFKIKNCDASLKPSPIMIVEKIAIPKR